MTPTSLNGLSVRFQQTASVPSVRQRRNLRLQKRSYDRLQSGWVERGLADPRVCRRRKFKAALWNRRKAKRAQRARFYCINGGEGVRSLGVQHFPMNSRKQLKINMLRNFIV